MANFGHFCDLEPEYIWQAFFRWQEIDNFGSASGNFGIRRCAFHKSVKNYTFYS